MIPRLTAACGLLAALLAGACASPSRHSSPLGAAFTSSATPTMTPTVTPTMTPTVKPPAASPAPCASTVAPKLASTGSTSQLVTVLAASYGATTAQVTLWRRSDGCWLREAGPWPGRLGTEGLSDHHREGDATTPTGAFGVGAVMYGIAPNPGVRYRYHRIVCGDWWDEDPSSPTYNTFQHVACGADPPFHGKSEALWKAATAYQRFAVVGYNAGPVVPGAGSAVFIHDDTGRPTIGCVSVAAANLDQLLRWLDPARFPVVVIGTEEGVRRA